MEGNLLDVAVAQAPDEPAQRGRPFAEPRVVHHDVIADEADVSVRDRMEKEELMKLVADRVAELPEIPKKILAMYYFEGMRLAEIAAVFDLTESRICQIHAQTVLSLRAFVNRMRNR